MSSVMDIASVSMGLEMRRIETVAHNISNATTPGFKRQLDQAFAALASTTPSHTSGRSSSVQSPTTDFSEGRLNRTDNPMHVALSGPGFFAVRTGNEIAFTRAGAFNRDADGRLVNPQGGVLQGDGGDLEVRSEDFKIELDGTVLEEQRPVGRVRVVDFENRSVLTRGLSGTFRAPEAAQVRVDEPVVRQGYLEMGNVDLGQEMVRMMEAFRRFEMGQKLIQGHEDMIGTAVRRMGDLQT